MARLPALAAALHSTDGRERPTIDLIARTVREAGLIATTKRGTGAAEMDVDDAVNLLIGASAVQSPRLAAAAVEQYRTLKQSSDGQSQGGLLSDLSAALTLPEALAILIEHAPKLDAMFIDWVERAYERTFDPSTDWILKPSLTVTFAAANVTVALLSASEQREWRFRADADLLSQRFYTVSSDGPGRRVTTTVLFPTFLALNAALFPTAERDTHSPA